MKKIKTINKLLSSLTLLSPLAGIGFNNQNQNTQNVITENYNNSLNNYFSSNEQIQMGDITVTVDGTIITKYFSGEGTLKVDSDITEIATNAFSESINQYHIFSLDLSQATSLTTIRQNAFKSTEKLAGTISIPSSVTSIEQEAFKKVDSFYSTTNEMILDLSHATSLTTIGQEAFAYCSNLTGNLVIPSGLETLGNKAFLGTKLTSVTVDDGNQHFSLATNLGPNAKVLISGTDGLWKDDSVTVGGLTLGDIVIPNTITSIAQEAFASTNITSLDLSQATNLTTIGDNAFQNCSNLTGNITIPSSVTSIGTTAFVHNHINNIIFLSETPSTFGLNWQPRVADKVYVPQGTKDAYSSASNFDFDSSQVVEWSFDSSSANISGNFSEINISNTDIGNSNSFNVSGCSPETLSNDFFNWSLVPTGETKLIPNGLSISKGTINWNNVAQGTYTFKIESSFNGWTKESDQIITINVTEAPIPPEPTPKKSYIPLILGLAIGLGIPVILAIAFIIWSLIRKKKTTVKI